MKKNALIKSLLFASTFAFGAVAFNTQAVVVPDGVKLDKIQSLVRGNGAEVETLDPHKMSGVPESNVLRDLLEGLVNQNKQGKVIPGVAESWSTKDNITWTFNLRNNAKWSNGDPVTAQDFVYSWRRLANPETASPYAWYMEITSIKNGKNIMSGKAKPDTLGVKALNDHTLEVILEAPLPYFPDMTNHTSMKPVNAKAVNTFGDKWTSTQNYVSNGAFMLDERIVNERIVLKRNPNYWDNKSTVIEEVTFLPIEDQTADMNRFLAGEIDMTYEIPNEQFKRLEKEQGDALKVSPYLCSYYYGINSDREPFTDVRIRKALSYAVDRDVLTKFVIGKGDTPSYSLSHENVAGLTLEKPQYAKWDQKKRDAEAIRLMKEAGYDKSKPLKMTLLYNTSENHKKIALAVSSMWKQKLGVEMELENQEWKTYLESQRKNNFDISRAGWCGDYNEASTFLTLPMSANTSSALPYAEAQYDAIINKAMNATSNEEREALYKQAEAKLVEDMPLIPLYHYVQVRLVSPKVGGYSMLNAEDNIYSKDLYKIAH